MPAFSAYGEGLGDEGKTTVMQNKYKAYQAAHTLYFCGKYSQQE
jgi:hypothetical protein